MYTQHLVEVLQNQTLQMVFLLMFQNLHLATVTTQKLTHFMKAACCVSAISESQSVPLFQVAFNTKSIYFTAEGSGADAIHSSNVLNYGRTWQETWSGTNHWNFQAIKVSDSILQCREWTYGSGNYVRPNSRKCKFYIK